MVESVTIISCVLQVAQLAEQLEKLLAGPTVSQAVGHMAVNIISNLMEGDSAALSASANRYNSHNPNLRAHVTRA